jgi:hypothetical protein
MAENLDKHWWSLRKGTTSLHVEWEPGAYGTVFAIEARMRKGPPVTLAFNLDKNFRTRHTGTGTYVDAQALADGGIARLKLVQVFDDTTVERLRFHLEHTEDDSPPWRLLLMLRGREHVFDVDREFRPWGQGEHLFLRPRAGLAR